MLNKEAIDALGEAKAIENAFKAMTRTPETHNIVALPSDYKLHDLEDYLPRRRRVRGVMRTPILAAFAAYTKAHTEAGATVFIDPQRLVATAALNLGTPADPGHADNLAGLHPEQTAAYRALLAHAADGKKLTQKQVAEFMEDWSDCIQCFNDAGAITNPKATAAVRKITIEAMRKLESTEQALSASRSAFESVQASSTEPLPTTLYFSCKPYADLAGRLFVLRLGVITSDEKTASITLRITKAEAHAEEMAMELANLVRDAMDGAMPVLLGTYSKSQ